MNLESISLPKIGCPLVLCLILCCSASWAQTNQAQGHPMGMGTMSFDLSRTTHIFQRTDDGGVVRVLVDDQTANDQILLIQQHLQQEAHALQSGHALGPTSLHGADMPGLDELRAGATKMNITYSPLPNGAEIIFNTADTNSLTAIHRWFGIQLSEHGAYAAVE